MEHFCFKTVSRFLQHPIYGLWWMQDGALAHWFLVVRERLPEFFGNCLVHYNIKLSGLPDHQTLLHMTFLCGYMKFQLFATLTIIDFHQRTLLEFEGLAKTKSHLCKCWETY